MPLARRLRLRRLAALPLVVAAKELHVRFDTATRKVYVSGESFALQFKIKEALKSAYFDGTLRAWCGGVVAETWDKLRALESDPIALQFGIRVVGLEKAEEAARLALPSGSNLQRPSTPALQSSPAATIAAALAAEVSAAAAVKALPDGHVFLHLELTDANGKPPTFRAHRVSLNIGNASQSNDFSFSYGVARVLERRLPGSVVAIEFRDDAPPMLLISHPDYNMKTIMDACRATQIDNISLEYLSAVELTVEEPKPYTAMVSALVRSASVHKTGMLSFGGVPQAFSVASGRGGIEASHPAALQPYEQSLLKTSKLDMICLHNIAVAVLYGRLVLKFDTQHEFNSNSVIEEHELTPEMRLIHIPTRKSYTFVKLADVNANEPQMFGLRSTTTRDYMLSNHPNFREQIRSCDANEKLVVCESNSRNGNPTPLFFMRGLLRKQVEMKDVPAKLRRACHLSEEVRARMVFSLSAVLFPDNRVTLADQDISVSCTLMPCPLDKCILLKSKDVVVARRNGREVLVGDSSRSFFRSDSTSLALPPDPRDIPKSITIFVPHAAEQASAESFCSQMAGYLRRDGWFGSELPIEEPIIYSGAADLRKKVLALNAQRPGIVSAALLILDESKPNYEEMKNVCAESGWVTQAVESSTLRMPDIRDAALNAALGLAAHCGAQALLLKQGVVPAGTLLMGLDVNFNEYGASTPGIVALFGDQGKLLDLYPSNAPPGRSEMIPKATLVSAVGRALATAGDKRRLDIHRDGKCPVSEVDILEKHLRFINQQRRDRGEAVIALVIVSVRKSGFERIVLMKGGKAMHPANGFIVRLSDTVAAVVTTGDAVKTPGASRPLEIELVYSSEADGNVMAEAAKVYYLRCIPPGALVFHAVANLTRAGIAGSFNCIRLPITTHAADEESAAGSMAGLTLPSGRPQFARA